MTVEDINTQRIIQVVRNNLRSTLQSNSNSTDTIQYATCEVLNNLCKQGVINGYDVSIDPTKHTVNLTVKPVMPINNITTTFNLSTNEISFEVAAIISND